MRGILHLHNTQKHVLSNGPEVAVAVVVAKVHFDSRLFCERAVSHLVACVCLFVCFVCRPFARNKNKKEKKKRKTRKECAN